MAKEFFKFLFIIIAGILIGLSFLVSPSRIEKLQGQKKIAEAHWSSGRVKIFRYDFLSYENLQSKAAIYNLDTVETLESSRAVLRAANGLALNIEENSKITIEMQKQVLHITLKQGDIQVTQAAPLGSVIIYYKGQPVDSTVFTQNTQFEIPTIQTNNVTLTNSQNTGLDQNQTPEVQTNPKTELHNPSSVIEQQVLQILGQQKQNYFKCYASLIQRTQAQPIQVLVSVTMEPSGVISQAKVTQSTFQEAQFFKCLEEVTLRIKMKGFTGKALSTRFPIKFE